MTSMLGTAKNAFKNSVQWLAEKPEDAKTFANPFGLIPSSGADLNRAGLIVERAVTLPTLFASTTAAVAGHLLGHAVPVAAAVAASKVAGVTAGGLTHVGMNAFNKAVNGSPTAKLEVRKPRHKPAASTSFRKTPVTGPALALA